MKKLVLGFVAVLAFGLNVNAKEIVQKEILTNNETVVLTKTEGDDLIKITIHIEWGRVSRGCDGFGFCKTEIGIDIPLGDIAFFGNVNANGNLQLEVTKKGLESINKKFGGNTIIVEEDFVLSDDVCKELGLKLGYTIKTGKYNLSTNRSGVTSVIL